MSASFDSAAFRELSSGDGYATWGKASTFATKKIPGSDDTVLQLAGIALPKLAMPIMGTASEMAALLGKVGVEGSLVFTYETVTARLESMEPPVSIGIGNDLYVSTLHLIRSSGAISPAPDTGSLILDSDRAVVTDDGGALVTDAPL